MHPCCYQKILIISPGKYKVKFHKPFKYGGFKDDLVELYYRYCGYCPELKFQVSDTYGNTTHRLLKKINAHHNHDHDNTNNDVILQDNSFSKPIVHSPPVRCHHRRNDRGKRCCIITIIIAVTIMF